MGWWGRNTLKCVTERQNQTKFDMKTWSPWKDINCRNWLITHWQKQYWRQFEKCTSVSFGQSSECHGWTKLKKKKLTSSPWKDIVQGYSFRLTDKPRIRLTIKTIWKVQTIFFSLPIIRMVSRNEFKRKLVVCPRNDQFYGGWIRPTDQDIFRDDNEVFNVKTKKKMISLNMTVKNWQIKLPQT